MKTLTILSSLLFVAAGCGDNLSDDISELAPDAATMPPVIAPPPDACGPSRIHDCTSRVVCDGVWAEPGVWSVCTNDPDSVERAKLNSCRPPTETCLEWACYVDCVPTDMTCTTGDAP